VRHGTMVAAGLVLAMGLTVTAAQAQTDGGGRAFTIGVAGGFAVPTGDFGADFDSEEGMGASLGFNLAASLGFTPSALPIGFRIEGSYNRFGLDAGDELGPGVDADYGVIGGTINAIVPVPTTGSVRPYLIGGIGIYRPRLNASEGGVSVNVGEANFGFNAGGGLRFPLGGLTSFVEARLTSTKFSVSGSDDIGFEGGSKRIYFVPIVFGIQF